MEIGRDVTDTRVCAHCVEAKKRRLHDTSLRSVITFRFAASSPFAAIFLAPRTSRRAPPAPIAMSCARSVCTIAHMTPLHLHHAICTPFCCHRRNSLRTPTCCLIHDLCAAAERLPVMSQFSAHTLTHSP